MLNVVIPVYNSRDTLPDLLDSLVAQTCKEFIVTLSCDADQSEYDDIVNEYRRRGLNIQFLRAEKNGGPGVARQHGIDASGDCDYVMCADADDIFNPRAVQLLYNEALRTGADMITSDFIQESENGDRYLKCDQTPCTWMHGRIYRLQFLRDHNIRFLDELNLNEDAYFNFVMTHCADHLYQIKECTYIWKNNLKSLTREEGSEGFFMKSWDGFLLSQIRGIQKIYEVKRQLAPETLARTMKNLYEAHMRARYHELDETRAIQYLAELKSCRKFQIAYRTPDFWQGIIDNAKIGTRIGDTLVIYKQKISDWLEEYVRDPNFIVPAEENENTLKSKD